MQDKTKHISARFDEPEAGDMKKFLTNRGYQSATHGMGEIARMVLYTMPFMEDYMRGRFSREELQFLVESQRGVPFFHQTAAFDGTWLAEIEATAIQRKIPPEMGELVRQKINEMSPFEVYLWREAIAIFWKTGGDIKKFLDFWCGEPEE